MMQGYKRALSVKDDKISALYYEEKLLREKACFNTHYVYFVSNNNGDIKIGMTRDPKRRMEELKNANPKNKLIGIIEVENKFDALTIESTFHNIFDNFKVYKEWFDEKSILEQIKKDGFSLLQIINEYKKFFSLKQYKEIVELSGSEFNKINWTKEKEDSIKTLLEKREKEKKENKIKVAHLVCEALQWRKENNK